MKREKNNVVPITTLQAQRKNREPAFYISADIVADILFNKQDDITPRYRRQLSEESETMMHYLNNRLGINAYEIKLNENVND